MHWPWGGTVSLRNGIPVVSSSCATLFSETSMTISLNNLQITSAMLS